MIWENKKFHAVHRKTLLGKKKKAGGRNPEMQPINSQGDDTVPQSDSLRLDTSHCLL